MRIRGVNFPDSLIKAQKEGRLVVFAGAGVSMPSPSNYPNFDRLAEKVAAGVLPRGPNEPTDHFLGRLADKKVKVHERVWEILSDPSSSPNSLHLNLLRLFNTEASVRLVTTNFDSHFTSAARTIFEGKEPEIFYAPALPLGDSFQGIAYLHGNVEKPCERLVLTDSDFGRAYLTQGWARRFLQQLFAKYTVLFVGYSRNDVVMEYLARGLPPQADHPGRFALKIEGDVDEHWIYRGIQPISYPRGSGDDPHAPLSPALAEWADESRRGPLEHEEKIKSIVQRPLSVDVEELDYIEASLGEVARVRFFRRFAKRTDWLTWIENKEQFSRLFRPETQFTQIDAELSQWFAENFVCDNATAGLAVVERKKQVMGWLLASSIARQLFVKTPRPIIEMGKWLPLLIDAYVPGSHAQVLELILSGAVFPEDNPVALILFEHLTRPEILLKKNIWREVSEGVEDISFELQTEGGEYWLQTVWEKFFKPHLDDFGDQLLAIMYSNLQRAHLLLRATGRNSPESDHLSHMRGMIESPSQGNPRDGIGVLISAACDVIQWSASSRPETLDFLIQTWCSSESQLLRRLAIFAVSKSAAWSADKKITWLLKQDLLYRFGFKHEVFLVIKDAYARASKKTRSAFLSRASRVRGRSIRPYEIYNLLYWLTQTAPRCGLARVKFEKFSASHPKFGPREHPDMDAWIGPVRVGLPHPLSVREVQAKSPDELLKFVSTFKPDDPWEKEGLMESVRDAASQSYEWSLKLAHLMISRGLRAAELWGTVISAWRQLGPSVKQWEEILSFLDSNDLVIELCLYEVSHLLEEGTKGTLHDIPSSLLPASKVVARKAWAASERSDDKREQPEDWLFIAINHPAGTLLTFWLRTLSKTRQELGDNWKSLPPDDEQFLHRVVSGSSSAAELGRVLIASQVNLLFSLDETWTIQNVIPLFDVSLNLRRAVQAWHGFLGWGGWNDRLLAHLLPKYVGAFPVVHSDFGEAAERFCDHLAWIAALSKIDPLLNGWLYRFLSEVTEDERVRWAASFGQALKGLEDSSKATLWEKWLGSYWKDRLEGIPVPLILSEGEAMAEWSIHLGPVFPQVVEKVLLTRIPDLKNSFMLTELSKSDLPKRYPRAAASLILYVLESASGLPWDTRWIEPLITELASSAEAKPHIRLACDELARLGYPDALRLKRLCD
jgi:hypothetical protein